MVAYDRIKKNNYLWNDVKPDQIRALLAGFKIHPFSRGARPELISQYIEKCNNLGELTSWTVALISNHAAKSDKIGGHSVGLTVRNEDTETTKDTDLYWLKKANIISPEDQYIDLEDTQVASALAATREAWKQGETRHKDEPNSPSGPFIRQARSAQRGLLLIYPLASSNVLLGKERFTDKPIIGIAMSFPASSKRTTVEYTVNTKYWLDRYGDDEDDV